jgi:hypothetical protein
MATCVKLQGAPCWVAEDEEGKKRVEMTTLWKQLTGVRGDKALASMLRRSGHTGPVCTVPSGVAGVTTKTFPGQRGHKGDKLMPCADAEGLLWLMAEMDAAALEAHRSVLMKVVEYLGGDTRVAATVQSRYPSMKLIENSNDSVHMVLRQNDVPRVALFSLLKSFAPTYNPSCLFHHRGLEKYFTELGISMPDYLSTNFGPPTSEERLHDDAAGGMLKRAFDSILPYERQLAAKSRGIVLGPCDYNNGTPVLLADFPVVVLVLFRLKTLEARSLQLGNFHQGLVLMGGNDDVALAMSQHWRAERDAQPSNQFLQFLSLAVDHEAAPLAAPRAFGEESDAPRCERNGQPSAEGTAIPSVLRRPKRARLDNAAVVTIRDVLDSHLEVRRFNGHTVLPEREAKRLLRLATSKFLDLVVREHPDLSDVAIKRKYSPDVFGQKTIIPPEDTHLAEAAILQALEGARSEEDPWVAPDIEGGAPATHANRCSSRPRRAFAVYDEEHSAAKDRANALWISLLLANGACAGSDISKVFYLDDFKEARGGLQLRTTEALLGAGFRGDQLFSANKSEAVVNALRRRGVHSFHGAWDDCYWDQESFSGIYLDLCTGSAGYAIQQLELASHRSEPGCILAWTITERDYEGEDLLLRNNNLVDLLMERGWRPACGRHLRPSTLLHRSSGGSRQRVLTQFWRKEV